MDFSHLKTINDLLEHNGYPIAYVQGHHTRIIKNSDGMFNTLGKKDINGFSAYTVEIYRGYDESKSVKAFIESEIG